MRDRAGIKIVIKIVIECKPFADVPPSKYKMCPNTDPWGKRQRSSFIFDLVPSIIKHKLLSVLELGSKPLQHISFHIIAFCYSFQLAHGQRYQTLQTCPTVAGQRISDCLFHKECHFAPSREQSRCCESVYMLTEILDLGNNNNL